MALTYATKRAKFSPHRGKAELIIGHLAESVDKKRAKNSPLQEFRIRERGAREPLFQDGTGRQENGVGGTGGEWDK